MRLQKRFIFLLAVAAVLTACGSGVSEEDLADMMEPLVSAHDTLDDFALQIGAGLTYGDVMAEWPSVSASVSADLDDFISTMEGEDFPQSESLDALSYSIGIASAHDAWVDVVEAVRGFIRDDEPETAIATKYSTADSLMDTLDDRKSDALTPGSSSEVDDDS